MSLLIDEGTHLSQHDKSQKNFRQATSKKDLDIITSKSLEALKATILKSETQNSENIIQFATTTEKLLKKRKSMINKLLSFDKESTLKELYGNNSPQHIKNIAANSIL